MSSIGLPEFLFIIPFAVIGLLFYSVLFFCIWKFYQMLSKINDNLAGIRRAAEQNGPTRPAAV